VAAAQTGPVKRRGLVIVERRQKPRHSCPPDCLATAMSIDDPLSPVPPAAAMSPADPALSPPARGLWASPDFLKLWTGQTISELGSRITREGIPLTALLVLHAGAAQMGLLSALGAAAVLVFGLVAGVWVDRVRRRPILIAADLGRAAVLASIPVAALAGALGMGQLYAVAAAAGVLTVFSRLLQKVGAVAPAHAAASSAFA
jgi:MFS family permease